MWHGWVGEGKTIAIINTVELDIVLKGINLALRWRLHDIKIWTGSATLDGLNPGITVEKRAWIKKV